MQERMAAGSEESQPPSPSRFSGLRRMFGRGTEPPRSNSGRGEVEQPPRPAVENGGKTEGIDNDLKAVPFFFRLKGVDAHPIATEKFINLSRDQYNAAWFSRELIQNFVDHNPQHPGTLDGVQFTSEPLPNDGRRFRIEGDWPFEDPTGVLSLHSDKPGERNTAGGNGIGLKQTAIRLLRDFGVERFEIDGEGWAVNYRLAKADDVNREWENIPGQVPLYKVKHDWLVAESHEAARTGKNAYVIETSNQEVIKALEQLPTLGVSSENPYLQNMDYRNKFGAIKWLPASDESDPVRGRLFINGQVRNYKGKGATAQDYWVGPESITIQLNNVRDKLSIDRPPLDPYELSGYLNKMINAMSKDDMIEQLKRSEHLWAGQTDSGYGLDKQGALVVVEKMARTLPYYKGYDRKEYQQHFAGKNYIACDIGLSESQIRELEKQGYIICPSYFAALGMPEASSKLSAVEVASNKTPKLTSFDKEQISQDLGMEVAHEDLSGKTNEGEFFKTVGERLTERVVAVEVQEGKPNTLRMVLKGEIPRDLLFRSFPKAKTNDQRFLNLVRGIAAYGLDHHIFKKIFTSQGDYVTTFGLNYDYVTNENLLLVRNVQSKSDQDPFIEVELDERYFADFQNALKASPEAEQTREGSDDSSKQKEVATAEKIDSGNAVVPADTEESPFDKNRIAEEVEMIKHDNEPEAPIKEVPNSARENEQQVELKQWTPEKESLYQLALQKRPEELTEDDKLVLQKKRELEVRFRAIPVAHPATPPREFHGQIIPKAATLSDAEKIRLAQMEQELPGIVEATNKLDNLIPDIAPQAPTGDSPTEKYMDWRESANFYGRVADLATTAGYITGKHLLELINEQNQAEIDVVDPQREKSPAEQILHTLKSKLDAVVKRMVPKEDDVNEFDLVYEPSPSQLAQLGLFRLYTRIVTGTEVPNDLFIYRGTGSKGINLGKKAIGLHESLFTTQFSEVLQTFAHEVAHNQDMTHLDDWRNALEALFVTMVSRISDIGNKAQRGEALTKEESAILQIQEIWDRLIAQEGKPTPALPPTPPSLGS